MNLCHQSTAFGKTICFAKKNGLSVPFYAPGSVRKVARYCHCATKWYFFCCAMACCLHQLIILSGPLVYAAWWWCVLAS